MSARDIKIAHSVFALPFALLGAFLARTGEAPWGDFAVRLVLIVACMVSARTWAMLVNRVVDRAFDAANPRTARRLVASGILDPRRATLVAVGAAGIFVACCALFWVLHDNPWPVALSVPVLAWIAAYSYTKRFTAWSHVVLGSALALSPLAAAIAVNPSAPSSTPALWWIAAMVVLWVAGFDVIYALQDVSFDRAAGLHSLPARAGVARSLNISRALHLGAGACLWMAFRSEARFGPVFAAGIALAWAALVCEHLVLLFRGDRGLDMAFFTFNGIVSCIVGGFGAADLVA